MAPKKRRAKRTGRPARRKAARGATARDLDTQHALTALARVKDDTMRYLLAMFIDLATERIAQLEIEAARRRRKTGR